MKKILIVLVALIFLCGCGTNGKTRVTTTSIPDSNSYDASQYPPVLSSESDLVKAMSGDLSVIKPFTGDLPNLTLARERLVSAGLMNGEFYYSFKNIADLGALTGIKLYGGWIVMDFKPNPVDAGKITEGMFNLHWFTSKEHAADSFDAYFGEDWVESDRTDRKGYYYHTSKETSTYTVIWMQDGYCFLASFPMQYGLDTVLDRCDVERVNVA